MLFALKSQVYRRCRMQVPQPRQDRKPTDYKTTAAALLIAIALIVSFGFYYFTHETPKSTDSYKPLGETQKFAWRAAVFDAWEKEVADAKKSGRSPDERKKPVMGMYGNMNYPWKNGLPTRWGRGVSDGNPMIPDTGPVGR
jgi:hypothetical protein